jgi:ArsR family transcriptional regulator
MQSTYDKQANLIKAIAHPARLRILEILAQEECCVCHLTVLLRQRQPFVSQHLMVLREKGLVLDRRDGVMVYYRLADKRVADLVLLTRELVRTSRVEARLEPVPRSPVPGCTCPSCVA